VKLALIGDPVDHSGSPELQRGFLAEAGIDGHYIPIRVAKGAGSEVARRLRADGYTGCNVTTPLKEELLEVCDELDEDARIAQAVNTLYFGDRVYGANTDGAGARSALETVLGEAVALHRIGILGTGATARAMLAQLRETDAYTFLWGREPEKVIALCERFECQIWPQNPPEIVLSALPPAVDLPVGLRDDIRRADLVMDSNYGARSTLGSYLERDVVKGELMLEAQARASFDFWLAHVEQVI